MQMFNEPALTSMAAIRPIQGWQEFLGDGNGYLRRAEKAFLHRNRIFTPGILYNIIAMAIEKFVMAALMQYGTLPYNHTMTDLVEAMEKTFPHAIDDIRDGLLQLDSYQDICDPYEFTIVEPEMCEIPAMLDLANKMQRLVESELTGTV